MENNNLNSVKDEKLRARKRKKKRHQWKENSRLINKAKELVKERVAVKMKDAGGNQWIKM